MKALIYEGPNQLRIKEMDDPAPKAGEVLVRIKACGICGSDVHGYLGLTGRRIAPMAMGHEFSGEIAALGDGLQRGFAVGDRVAVQPVDFCGMCAFCRDGFTNLCENKRFFGVLDVSGALAEYLCVPEKLLYRLPDSIGYDEGALIEALAVSYCALKKAGGIAGKSVLIVGGGTIGQLALCAAKTMNPKRIVLSDFSQYRLSIAKKLGADDVINPADGDFDTQLREKLGGLADVSIEAVGVSGAVGQAISALKPLGTCVLVGNSSKIVELDMQAVVTRALKIFGTFIYTHAEFGETIDFMARNKMDLKQLITGRISLEEAPEMFAELAVDTEKHLKVVVKF